MRVLSVLRSLLPFRALGVTAAPRTSELLPRVHVAGREEMLDHHCWTFPNPDVTLRFVTDDGRDAGFVTYGVDRRQETALVYNVEVGCGLRRNGYGLALLHYVATRARADGTPVRLAPVHEVDSAEGFWAKARDKYGHLFSLAPGINLSDLADWKAKNLPDRSAWLVLEAGTWSLAEGRVLIRKRDDRWWLEIDGRTVAGPGDSPEYVEALIRRPG